MAKRFLTPINLLNLASDPAIGSEGDIYFNTTSDVLKIYVNGAWTTLTGGGGGAAINVSASAPVSPAEGDAWFDNTDGKFYVYDGSFWVETGQTDAVFSSYNRWTKVMSASTSTITGVDDNGTTLDYSPGLEQVYINGAFIDKSSYTVNGGSSIILDEPVYSTDLVEILWLENVVIADTYSKVESDAKYLSLTTASSTYLTITSASSTYATKTELNNIDLSATINTASAAAYGSASAYTNSQINALTTTDIEEGTNLYFTNQRAIDSGSATYILQSNQQSIINTASAATVSYLVDSAPSTLDTLNELAQALGDDPNYATTITNALGNKLDSATASATYLTQSNASATYATKTELENIDALPSQTGNAGKYLTTDGASASWGVLVIPETASAAFTRWTKVMSGSATVISGADDNSISLDYDQGLEQVYINGVLLARNEYTATSGSSVVLNDSVILNDVVDIVAYTNSENYSTYTQTQIDSKYNSYTRWKKIYGASATVISGLDDNSNTLSYTPGYESVYLNGVLLSKPGDYAATSASVVTMASAVAVNDVVEIISYQPFNIANTYTTSQADNLFLTQSSASSTYLTQSSASSTYLTQAAGLTATTASSTYLTQSSASATYYTQTQIDTLEKGPAFNTTSGALTISHATWTKIPFNNENFDTNNNFNTTNNRFTPTVAGYYMFTLSVFMGFTSNRGAVAIYKNGGSAIQRLDQGSNSNGGISFEANGLLYMNGSTDYVEGYVYQESGGNVNMNTDPTLTQFSGCMIRRA